MVFNATFNNISVISWRSVLLMEETGVPRENQSKSLTNFITYCCIEYTGFKLITLVVIGTDCTGSCKFSYNTITTTTAPFIYIIADFQQTVKLGSKFNDHTDSYRKAEKVLTT